MMQKITHQAWWPKVRPLAITAMAFGGMVLGAAGLQAPGLYAVGMFFVLAAGMLFGAGKNQVGRDPESSPAE